MGLYLAPPAAAVVLCVDEKSGVQALDRTQPLLPLKSIIQKSTIVWHVADMSDGHLAIFT